MSQKRIILVFLILTFSYPVISQVRVAPEKRYVKSLPEIREADVLWAKRIWRQIDLRQSINKILKEKSIDSLSLNIITFQKYLIEYFIKSDYIKNEYNILTYNSSNLNKRSIISTKKALVKLNTKIISVKSDSSDNIQKEIIEKEFNPANINKIYLMEDWFQIRGKAELDFRILAIGFAYNDNSKVNDSLNHNKPEEKIMWFFYPNLRPFFYYTYLPYSKLYNESISIDDFFLKRKFESSIIKVQNVYGNKINVNLKGKDAVLKSEALKKQLMQMEQNLKKY